MAVYNNGYPYNYPYYQPAQQINSNQNSGIIWVSGEAGAKAYMVAPNNTVQLWDSEAQVIYLKSADASGMPSIKVLDYTIRDTPSVAREKAAESRFATKDDIACLEAKIIEIRKEFTSYGKSHLLDDESE